jgi:hypothetical protein
MDLLGGLTSLLSGGVTGLVGSAIGGYFTYKSKKLDIELQKEKYANDVALKELDSKIMAQEWAARTQVAQVTADAQVESEDAKAFAASLTSEPQRYAQGSLTSNQNWLMVLLDSFRGIIRPGLTLYLAALTTMIYLQAHALLGSSPLTTDQATGLVTKIIDTVLYLTTTCVLFWFGSRVHEKKSK